MIHAKHQGLDSKTVACIIQVYDAAWDSLRGSIFASARRAAETRAILAHSIIEMAERGERDPIHLQEGVLRCFGMR